MMTLSAMRALCDQWASELPAAEKPIPLGRYREHIDRQLKEYEITVEWRHPWEMPSGAAAYAHVARRHIVCPHIISEVEVAICLHEMGHCMAEPCRGGLHRPNPAVRDWHHCIRCEVLGWCIAPILIRPLPWSKVMHQRLAHSLETYRRMTPASDEALRQLDRLTADLSRLVFKQKALEASLQPPPPPAWVLRERARTPEQVREDARWRELIDGWNNEGAHAS